MAIIESYVLIVYIAQTGITLPIYHFYTNFQGRYEQIFGSVIQRPSNLRENLSKSFSFSIEKFESENNFHNNY